MPESIWNLVRDALRYRELRKHVNRGYPLPGVPFVSIMTSDSPAYYIREGELDDAMNTVFDTNDKWDEIDRLSDLLSTPTTETA